MLIELKIRNKKDHEILSRIKEFALFYFEEDVKNSTSIRYIVDSISSSINSYDIDTSNSSVDNNSRYVTTTKTSGTVKLYYAPRQN